MLLTRTLVECNTHGCELSSEGLKLSIGLNNFQGKSTSPVYISNIGDHGHDCCDLGILEPGNSPKLDRSTDGDQEWDSINLHDVNTYIAPLFYSGS
jgi:hypothetical protein